MSNKGQKSGDDTKIILASGSIARKKLMKKLEIPFQVHISGYEEDMGAIYNPQKLAKFLALGKAEWIAPQFPNALIIGADTFIVVEGEKVGKPTSLKHADEMVKKMSGKWIDVVSGIAVVKTSETGKIIQKTVDHETTRLKIKAMTKAEIQLLVNQKNVLKISGAFGIEGVGGKMVEKIKGDYDNVIGLPLKKLEKILTKFIGKSKTSWKK